MLSCKTYLNLDGNILSLSSLSFQDIYVNGSVGDGELWTDTWGRDLHHHPLFVRQGQGLEQGKFIGKRYILWVAIHVFLRVPGIMQTDFIVS